LKNVERQPDWVLLWMPVLIFFAGLFFIYSASWREGQPLDQSLVTRQSLWMLVALGIMMISLKFHYRYILDGAWGLYAVTCALLVLVLFAPAKLGAHRWIDLGFFNLQPSELAKLSVIAALAVIMKDRGFGQESRKDFVFPVVVVGLPLILILKEPDLGTSLLFIPVFLAMLYISGFKMRWILSLLALMAAIAPFLYHKLEPYQQSRILTFLNPDRDPLGAGYTIIQSKIAIGSGGLWGKGFMSGSQTQLRFLPERHTDFILSVIGEEGGFIAAGLIVAAYALIIFKGYSIANHCANRFGKLLAVGITTLLATQAIVNISMTMGLLPVVGMPLFLVSYGGSSAIVSMFLIGILINIGMRRDPFL
jgi:rod shape determining protein RodA